ncbi:MAG TPA: hypothetical protein VF079_05360 [Sphingomicrobium sp.]
MRLSKPLLICSGSAVALVTLAAAQRPAALAQAGGGLWEVSGVPGARVAPRLCVADPAMLAQFEHRRQACTRVVISDTPPSTVIHYTCALGGFGRSRLTMITPRSIRIETQGISGDLPFNYVLQARRVGECPQRQSLAAH